jgi:hypothetical protein
MATIYHAILFIASEHFISRLDNMYKKSGRRPRVKSKNGLLLDRADPAEKPV